MSADNMIVRKDEPELVGYLRRSLRNGQALKINISLDAFAKGRAVASQDGRQYLEFIVSTDKVRSVIDGEREVTSICQMVQSQT